MHTITPLELNDRLTQKAPLQLVDVREPDEVQIANLGAINIPLGELVLRHHELDPQKETVVICHHGIRSGQAAILLGQLGFSDVKNLLGGIDRWSVEVDPGVHRY